jgi:putative FmdB family regulatory protein
MPRYGFRCEACGLEFDVSRRFEDAGADAQCPVDGARAPRVFTVPTMFFQRRAAPGPAAPKPAGSGFSHHGHSHGPGASPHSH